ncbi:MAG: membrane dipeptidase [Actinomycetota bacterium]
MTEQLDIADAHNDLLLACQHRRERGRVDPFGDDWLPGLRAGGVVLQVLPIFTEEQFIGEGALRRTLEILSLAREIADMHSADVAIVETVADLDAALASRRIALVLAIEGAEPIGSSVSMFDTLWRLGVRMTSLTWNRRTMFADGIGERDTEGRLTSLGVEAVAEMERLGMIVDVSHLSAPGVAHLAEVARAPFVATHSSCRALCDHPRNLTDEQLRLIAGSGGFVGINAFGPFIATDGAEIAGVVHHLAHAASVVGPGHVALGADFLDDLVRLVDPILGRNLLVDPADLALIEGFRRPADFAALAPLLVERFGRSDAERIASRTMIEFFRSQLPAS